MADINRLVEELGKLTVIEAGELSKKLEKAWGLNLDSLMSQSQAVQQEEKQEASLFKVILTGFEDGKKIPVIQKIRNEFIDCFWLIKIDKVTGLINKL